MDEFIAITPKDDPKDKIEVELGDSKDSTKFHPQVKLMRWDNEVNASFRLQGFSNYQTFTDLQSVSLINTTK